LVGAVASARAQTVADIEILVRDDAGGGNVQGLLAEIRDDRIVYRRNSQNLGPAATNILLYKEARGKYVAHLDDDDEWESQFLARLVEPLEQYPDLNLTFCNDVVIDAVGRPQLARTAIVEKQWGRARLGPGLHQNGRYLAAVARAIPTGHAAVIRRSALDLKLLDAGVVGAWDMLVASIAVRHNGLAWFEPSRLTRYRAHEGQRSDVLALAPVTDSKFEGLVHCLECLIRDPLYAGERRALRRGLSKQRGTWALARLTLGRNEEALDQARAALHAFPTTWALAVWLLTELANVSTLPVGRLVASGGVTQRRLRRLALNVRSLALRLRRRAPGTPSVG
jgi:hypothetical protein